MARVNWSLDDRGAVIYSQLLKLREERVTHAYPAFDAIADDIEALEEAVFSTQGRLVTGGGWRPNSEMTRRIKRRFGLADRVLEMARPGTVGRLRRSLTREGAPWSVRRVSNDEAERGTSLGIGKIHQTGGTATLRGRDGKVRQVRIPRRRFMQTRAADRHRWLGYLEDQLRDGNVRRRRIS